MEAKHWKILSIFLFLITSFQFIYITFLSGTRDSSAVRNRILEYAVGERDRTIEELKTELAEVVQYRDSLLERQLGESLELNDVYKHMNRKDWGLAQTTRLAAKITHIDPLLLTALINSESSYVIGVKHELEYVVGLGGINTRYWKYPVNTPEEQIYATALVLKVFLDINGGDILGALHAYKGRSPLGKRQAELVFEKYLNSHLEQ